MMNKTNCSEQTGWQAVKCIWEKYSALWLVPAFILGITVGFAIGYSVTNQYAFVESMIPEIVGIGISITGIYYLEQWRQGRVEEARLKEELLWQAKSQSNETAKSAIDRIRYKGWLTGDDGLLVGADLSLAKLDDANLREANLRGVEFKRGSLNNSRLGSANLENVDFYDVQMANTQLPQAILVGATLDMCDLSNSNLIRANLNGANLTWANLQGADLSRVDLRDTILNTTNLTGANLNGARLNGTQLEKTILSGAVLIGASLEGATINSVLLDETTILPDGSYFQKDEDLLRFVHPTY